jgi:hypothetical protein
VTLTQYGPDWKGHLSNLPRSIAVDIRNPIPWREAITESARHHLALVVGAHDPSQLPSKAVNYLTLPIPRFALTTGRTDDSVARYIQRFAGWLAAPADAPELPQRIAAHVQRDWDPDVLAPPVSESWPDVIDQLSSFITESLSGSSA